jgi:hypothetical protein
MKKLGEAQRFFELALDLGERAARTLALQIVVNAHN